MSAPFARLLIANRGEISVRVIRACQELGIRSVAVYSEADRGALHTRLADEAHLLGPAPAAESYLDVERILDVARRAGAEAVHPGYGFLAENAEFAQACSDAGIVFVGPPPAAMRLLGDKAAARRIAGQHGVPVVLGYDEADQADDRLVAEGRTIGFPLLIKAAAGGGGRGMRVVERPEAFLEALASARREATAAFGDGAVILERYVAPARHVEVQVLGDRFGAMVHLGERECSVQRRHQKVIEESPSPATTPDLRNRLGRAAVTVALAAGYHNAGTCEFLLDALGEFYFIEMNARLQVEHPVTEQVSGLDIVQRQIALAAGQPLGLTQDQVALRGHAVECRLYAEDPAREFVPSGGRLTRFQPPNGLGLRHDVGFAEGDTVNTFYDAMLAKVIAYGEDRATALARARWAIDHFDVEGVATNLRLLRWVLRHPTFVAGQVTTDFLAREWRPQPPVAPTSAALAAAAVHELDRRARSGSGEVQQPLDPWDALGPWRPLDQGIALAYEVEGAPRLVVASRQDEPDGIVWSVASSGAELLARVVEDGAVRVGDAEGQATFRVESTADGLLVAADSIETPFLVRPARPPSVDRAGRTAVSAGGPTRLEAPMPGRVVRVAVQEGDRVREHQPLVVLEAMKIEHTIAAPRSGVVKAVHCQPGDQVDGGAVLVEVGE